MKLLRELAQIITKSKASKIEVLDEGTLRNPDSKFNQFYRALLSGKIQTDEEAAELLYQSTPKDDRYRQLKSRFRKRLLNTLFFLDINTPTAGTYEQALANCHRLWAQINLLQQYHAHSGVNTLSKKLLALASDYGFTGLSIAALRVLRKHALQDNQRGDFECYHHQLKELEALQQVEQKAASTYQTLQFRFQENPFSPTTPEENQNIEVVTSELVELSEQYSSPSLVVSMYRVWALRFEFIADFQTTAEVCRQALSFFQDHPNRYARATWEEFQIRQMRAYLHIGDFSAGKSIAEALLQKEDLPISYLIEFYEYYLLLALRTDQFTNALAIYQQVNDNLLPEPIPSIIQEKWQTFSTYLHLLFHLTAHPISSEDLNDLAGKMEDTPPDLSFPHSKDVRSLLVHQFIVHTLLAILRGQLGTARAQIKKLKNWSSGRLKLDAYHRINQFIKLLGQLEKADFDPQAMRKTQRYLQELKNTPLHYRGYPNELEPYPLEDLWAQVLQKLL